jgi:hypothetical protein
MKATKRRILSKEIKNYVKNNVESLAESNIEAWKERYSNYRTSKALSFDLNVNHDPSLEIEAAEEELERKLTDDERSYLIEQFNKEVVRVYKRDHSFR